MERYDNDLHELLQRLQLIDLAKISEIVDTTAVRQLPKIRTAPPPIRLGERTTQ
jgi:hypothetical protein